MPEYDSRPETLEHITTVGKFIDKMIAELKQRKAAHDQSKLDPPEKQIFDEVTGKLKGMTYGSDEYNEQLKSMKGALDHHYANNRHHPEHHANGVKDMNMVDWFEMLTDWKAATLRHDDGDIRKSIEINQKRFGYSDDIKHMLLNSLDIIE
jgi:hypothetical protein